MTGEPMHPEAAEMIEVATGGADVARRARVQMHAASCPRCQGLLQGLVAAFVPVRPTADASARMSDRFLQALGDAPQIAAHLDDADIARLAAGDEAAAHEAAHLGACRRCAGAFEALEQTRSFVLQATLPTPDASARMTASFAAALDQAPAHTETSDDDVVAYAMQVAGTPVPEGDASARMAARFVAALASEAPARVQHLDGAALMAAAVGEDDTWSTRAHLDGCADCATSLRALSQATTIARALAPEPSPFVAARIERNIARALDGDVRSSRGLWRPTQVAAAMAVAAVVGAGFAAGSRLDGPTTHTAQATAPTPAQIVSTEIARGDALAAAGHRGDAVVAYTAALGGDVASAAGARIEQLVKQGGDQAAGPLLDLVDAHLASATAPEAMRVRCDLLLRWRSDGHALEACQDFVAAHPAHPARGALEGAVGRLAAQRLAAATAPTVLDDARARLLQQTTGLSSPAALLDRARCRADLGDDELARADLRVAFLVDPALSQRADVSALARTLGVQAP